ncbi:low affinity immunoglobulin gamma Fc region receptor II-like isoform X2 [Astatotilapia calliptera]|uniref:low affinity immunoglobulin gamma Fc region receptor II-like isoform X2 n=1 Tax=Astatotilapia calliptera TaxID=8154 RepID=UPI000E40A71D|nr:low affinity immunoglobulin gamma Fc region receptor II-like isoform X2 [Astatotilapia calliptera]
MVITTPCFRLLILEVILLGTHVRNSLTQKRGAATLRVTPNRLQHFQYEPLSFDCESPDGPIELRGVRTSDQLLEHFSPACNSKTTSSSCTISQTYVTDSAEYWCEVKGGQRTNSVNITITDGSVILQSPVFPVFEGNNVTLRCISKTTHTNQRANFYKDDGLIDRSPSDNMEINSVSRSDEGRYKCSISGVGTSPESWLHVRSYSSAETPSDDSSYNPVLILLWTVLPILVIILMLLVVGFLNTHKHQVSSKTSTVASNSDEDHPGDDISEQPVYTTVIINKTEQTQERDSGLSRSTLPPIPPAVEESSSPETVIYSPIQKATMSKLQTPEQ